MLPRIYSVAAQWTAEEPIFFNGSYVSIETASAFYEHSLIVDVEYRAMMEALKCSRKQDSLAKIDDLLKSLEVERARVVRLEEQATTHD